MIRDAVLADVPALVDLENRCFATDRLSARSFRHFLTRSRAALILDAEAETVRGYCLVLFHRNTSLARLYSMAVDPSHQQRGIGRILLEEAERRALDQGATRMRLEVHEANTAGQVLYRSRGYRHLEIQPDYYEDHASALRMEKELAPHLAPHLERAPYYRQTLDFTCGPASLMMAMKAQDASLTFDRDFEIQLWREATTVFMTSGIGGCGALGLALAAVRRGFTVEVSASEEAELFARTVRSDEKKEVIRLVERRFFHELAEVGVHVRRRPLSAADLRARLARSGVPVVLISSYRLTGDRSPHWVVLTAQDDRFVYLNDPYVDIEENRSETDCIGIPIVPSELDRMMRLGRRQHFATVVVYGKGDG